MTQITDQGREYALAQLQIRRDTPVDQSIFDNSKYYAGSPMYFPCQTCNQPIEVPESYVVRAVLCEECAALLELEWF